MGAREGEAARKGKRQEREQIKQNVTSRVCFLLPKAAIQHASSSSTCVCARVRACERVRVRACVRTCVRERERVREEVSE